MDSPPPSHARPPKRHDDGRLVRGRKSRTKIHEAARALFREQGFDKTTLREIAARAGMGASSIYRHIRSKEELLVDELGELQQRAWARLRARATRSLPARERLRRFLDAEHALLVRAPDLTTIALRATTHPEARVARRALALQDQTIGLIAEILQSARARGELRRGADVLVAARTLTHAIHGARLAWTNGLLDAEGCRASVEAAVTLLFDGIGARTASSREEAKLADAAPDLLTLHATRESEQARRDRRSPRRRRAVLELRRSRGAREPARERDARPRRGPARPRGLVRSQLARRRRDDPRRAQDRGHRRAAQLPLHARRGRLRRRQLRRRVRVGRRRPRGALRRDPPALLEARARRDLRRPAGRRPARRRGAARGRERCKAREARRRAADDDLHLGHHRPSEGRRAQRPRRPRAGARAGRLHRLPPGRHLSLDRSALSLGPGRLHGPRLRLRPERRAPAQVRRRGLAAPRREVPRHRAPSRRRRRSAWSATCRTR